MYKRVWSLVLHQLVIGTFSLFINVLPEAICCCLQTCYIDVMLLLMDFILCVYQLSLLSLHWLSSYIHK